jgi:hypothetical protein
LVDIKKNNGTYTWTNKRSGNHQIACRLDHFLILENFLLEGSLVESNILSKASLDHGLIQVWVDTISTPKIKPFRFAIFCLSHPDFQELARHWWSIVETQDGHQNVLLLKKTQTLQTTGMQMEKIGLWEHFLGEEITGTKY